ncbi:hypothetical protein ACGF5C_21015 [Micromonospora sp. NPDC047620]|uniref:hypothetical protein n=1 Tax=Micromonospora sp. NPDC047620 TaxID=3364251 RepID=UPI003720CA8A
MIPDEIKQQIIKNVDKKRDKTLSDLREVLGYPYHPDTRALIFRVEGDYAGFGMNLLAVDEHGGRCSNKCERRKSVQYPLPPLWLQLLRA